MKVAKNSNGFSLNERIQHEDYGPGTIPNSGHVHTPGAFHQAGTKKFMNSLLRLERSDVADPERRELAWTDGKSAKKKAARQADAGVRFASEPIAGCRGSWGTI